MAIDHEMREVKEKVLKIFVGLIPSFITPNHITFMSFIFGLISAYYASQSLYMLGLTYWAANRIFDGIDG